LREAAEAEDFLDALDMADEFLEDDPLEERDPDLLDLLDLDARLALDALLDTLLVFETALLLLSLSESELELALLLDARDFALFVDRTEASDAELERERLLLDETDGELWDRPGEGLELASERVALASGFGSAARGFKIPFGDPFCVGEDLACLRLALAGKPFVLGSFGSSTVVGTTCAVSPLGKAFDSRVAVTPA
jgi:hypothetical protein